MQQGHTISSILPGKPGNSFRSYLLCICSCLLWALCFQPARAQRQLLFHSSHMPHPDTVLVFTPNGKTPAQPMPLLYLLHGYSEKYTQWNTIAHLQQVADQYRMIIVCPDGFQTWYLNSPQDDHSQFDTFFFEELVPAIHRQYRIDKAHIFISGLSMGGYGALRMFLLQPAYFTSAAATSGAVDFDFATMQSASRLFFGNDRVINDLTHLLGSPEQNNWQAFSLANLLRRNTPPHKPFLFDCGTADPLYPMNNALKQVCDSLHLPVTYITQPGEHNAAYWQGSIRQHLAYFSTFFK